MRAPLTGVLVVVALLLLGNVWHTNTFVPPAPAIEAERTVAVDRVPGSPAMFCTDLESYSRLLRAVYPINADAQRAELPRCPAIPVGSRVRVASLPWDISTATGPTYRVVEVQVLTGNLAGQRGYLAVRDLTDK